jgi:hypothetical protein
VPRDRWERVQHQLDRNITFSPRNEKHAYLLKGLVRCGGCGARYGGDPCHGRFYYRCIARCKRMPSITERILDDAVIAAIRNVILKPEVILQPLRQLDRAEARELRQRKKAAKDVEPELARLKAEEGRILEAYRTEIITPAQLGQQLELVKVRRAELELQRSEVQREPTVPPEQGEKAVADYCTEAARNLATFTEERWREFLRTIIHTVVFQGHQITIQGRIPIGESADKAAVQLRLAVPLLSRSD